MLGVQCMREISVGVKINFILGAFGDRGFYRRMYRYRACGTVILHVRGRSVVNVAKVVSIAHPATKQFISDKIFTKINDGIFRKLRYSGLDYAVVFR